MYSLSETFKDDAKLKRSVFTEVRLDMESKANSTCSGPRCFEITSETELGRFFFTIFISSATVAT